MISFEMFLERTQKNPLRKKELLDAGWVKYDSPEFLETYKTYYRKYPLENMDDPNDQLIKRKYDHLLKSSEDLAEKYLESELIKIFNSLKKPTTKEYKKVYENQGVQVFIDEENLPDSNYSPETYNYRIINAMIIGLLNYIRDILPNRKPKIIITDLSKNKYTSESQETKGSAGIAFSKLIFIDWRFADDLPTYIHEYAHYVTDLIPSQSKKLLVKSFVGLINEYYKKMKKRTIKPGEPFKISNRTLVQVANKLEFPDYGTQNPDEFFAMVIEKWKDLPKNKAGYKFKSLVKNVLNRV